MHWKHLDSYRSYRIPQLSISPSFTWKEKLIQSFMIVRSWIGSRYHLYVNPQISLHSFVNEDMRLRSDTMDPIPHSTASNVRIDKSANFSLILRPLGVMRTSPMDML